MKKVFCIVFICVIGLYVIGFLYRPIAIKLPFSAFGKGDRAVLLISFSDRSQGAISPFGFYPCVINRDSNAIRKLIYLLEEPNESGDVATCESVLLIKSINRTYSVSFDSQRIVFQSEDTGIISVCDTVQIDNILSFFKPYYAPIVFL